MTMNTFLPLGSSAIFLSAYATDTAEMVANLFLRMPSYLRYSIHLRHDKRKAIERMESIII